MDGVNNTRIPAEIYVQSDVLQNNPRRLMHDEGFLEFGLEHFADARSQAPATEKLRDFFRVFSGGGARLREPDFRRLVTMYEYVNPDMVPFSDKNIELGMEHLNDADKGLGFAGIHRKDFTAALARLEDAKPKYADVAIDEATAEVAPEEIIYEA